MNRETFDLADVFESLVDWPKRLAGEGPFFRSVLDRVRARRVLDTACGTGQHAAFFHSLGMEVEGADISAPMIERARALHGEPEGLRWTVRGYAEPSGHRNAFDAVICVGNSLALSPDRETACRGISEMLAAVRDGGAVVIHLLNLWRIAEGPALWQKCRRADSPDGEALIIKGVHRTGDRAWVELLLSPVTAPERMRTASLNLVALDAEELRAAFGESGAATVEIFGGYQRQPYRRRESVDIVAVALKGDLIA